MSIICCPDKKVRKISNIEEKKNKIPFFLSKRNYISATLLLFFGKKGDYVTKRAGCDSLKKKLFVSQNLQIILIIRLSDTDVHNKKTPKPDSHVSDGCDTFY